MKAYFHGLRGGMEPFDALQKDYNESLTALMKKREAEERARLARKRALLDAHAKAYFKARDAYEANKRAKPGFTLEGKTKTTKIALEALHKAYADEIDWLLANVSAKEIEEDGWNINLENALKEKEALANNKKLVGWGLEGGRGQASGFIMRAMAENKLKHKGQYKNPTYPLAPGSSMNKPIEFDWRKLANKSQGGEKEVGNKTTWGTKGEYGASPFILHHFSGSTKEYKKGKKDYPKESDTQQKARMIFTAKNLLAKAKKLAEASGTPAPTMTIADVAPTVVPEATKADIIEHFGNAPELKKKFKVKKKFVDADTGEELGDARNEPPTPKNEVVETAPPPPEPKVEPVAKKTRAKKSAKTATPPNPVSRVVWTAEEIRKNPITRGDTTNYFDDLDDRQQKLFIFALNNPKAKLKDAKEFLKDNKLGEGFSSSTISPIFKEIRREADGVLEEEEKQNKTLSNPAFQNIKAKFDALLKTKGDRPMERIKNAFKDIDYQKYIDVYNKTTKITGEEMSYNIDEILAYKGDGKWQLYGSAKRKKAYKLLTSETFEGGFEPSDDKKIWNLEEHAYKYGDPQYWATWTNKVDVINKEGKAIPTSGKIVVRGLHKVGNEWRIEDDNISLFISSSEFPKPEPTPAQYINNQMAQNSYSGLRPQKPTSRVFYNKELYRENQHYWIGKYILDWADDTAEFNKGRSRKIGNARRAKAYVKELETNDWLYTTHIDGVEYVCPKGEQLNKDYEPDEEPEKRGGYKLNKVSDADAKDPEEIKRLPIRNRERYNRAKANLLEALSNYTVPPVSSRADLLGKESGMMAGKKSGEGIIARGVAFGFGNNRKGYHYFVKNKDHPEVYKALVEFGEAIVPKGWDFQTIQLNHNAKARKHVDKNNVGKSVIIGIGDYNGGELRVFSPDSSKHKDYNIKDKPTMFNGAVLPHETQPFSNPTDYERGKGRYTIVYFRHKYKPDSGNVGVGSGNTGMSQPSASELRDLFV